MKPDHEALARIRDAIKRGDREVDLGAALGIPLTMVRNADGRVEVRGPDGGEAATTHSQVWDPTPTRPTDYPAGLPFVPNVKAAVVIGSDAHMTNVQWFNPAEPLARLDQLVEESLTEGWQLQSAPPRIAERPGEHRWLVQGNRIRFFSFVGSSSGDGLLALMQMEHE
ncbi:MAG: hypothetical protein AMS18_12040 [Gemmatimonas sp. SG8_17]|nr:MAG: hypothetical protein AMS18_12040 [Gemmatimonas sp. SG8_17]